ncbi:hypothetical protein ACFQH6_00695 [Halobacteriaceae archaeon GCM10025711]
MTLTYLGFLALFVVPPVAVLAATRRQPTRGGGILVIALVGLPTPRPGITTSSARASGGTATASCARRCGWRPSASTCSSCSRWR